jgi:membrane protein DedA with SNARE-associated domain
LGEVQNYIGDYGYLAVSLGILLEDFGMPTPGETLLITGSILASDHRLNIFWLLPLAWLSAVIGDNIGYFIGLYGGHRLMVRYGSRIGITDERLKKVEEGFENYGGWVIVFARFVIVLRQFNGIVAGTLEMHWLHFFVLNAVGAALWVGFWGILAYWLGKGVFDFINRVHNFAPVLLVLFAVVAVGGAAYLWWLYRRGRSAS